MRETNELQQLLEKTFAKTTLIDANIGKMSGILQIDEPIKIRFNRNYFITVKLLEAIFEQQYKEERGALFVNEALVKFSYLAQIFLNCFCIEATLYADNIDYSCFELSILYSAILNLAKKNKFHNLVNKLEEIHLDIFKPENHRSAFTALVNTDVDIFKKRFYNEIALFEQQVYLHYDATTKSKVTYIHNLAEETKTINYQQLWVKLLHTKQPSFMQQLIFKFIQFNYFNPLLIVSKTKQIIADLLKVENPPDGESTIQKKLETACQQYQEKFRNIADTDSISITPSTSLEVILSFPPNYASHKLAIKCIYLNNVYFNKTKISIIRGGQFVRCSFNNANLDNIQFTQCTFFQCDFKDITISGALNNCRFVNCNFDGAVFEWLELNGCIIDRCNMNKTSWYRVKIIDTQIFKTSIIAASIRFSNIEGAEFLSNNLTQTLFVGSRVKLSSAKLNTWTNVNLDGALYLADISANNNTFSEHLFVNIGARLIQLFGNRDNCANLLISSGEITSRLSQIIEDETPLTQQNYRERFRQFLGWMLCAADRLTEYCKHYQKNKNTFNFKDSMTNFEILADALKTAVNFFKHRYLTLHDKCHLSLITEFISVYGIFRHHQQYEDALFKDLKADPNFIANPIEKDDIFPKNNKHKKESLLAIQQLTEALKKIDITFLEMRNQITEQEHMSENNTQPQQSLGLSAS